MSKSKIHDSAEAAKILTVARRYVFTHGFRTFTMDTLAAEADIGKKVIYTHFHGKQLLLEALIIAKVADMDRDLTAAQEAGGNFSKQMHAMFSVLREHAEEYSEPFIQDLLEVSPAFFEWTKNKRTQLLTGHFAKLFAQGRREGAIRSDISDDLFMTIYEMLTSGILMGRILKKTDTTVAEIYNQTVSILLEGTLKR